MDLRKLPQFEIEVEYEIEQRLQNWKRYVRTSKKVPISCRSLESRYKSPPMYEMPIIKIPTDHNDAWLIEKTLTNATFPRKSLKIIIYAYIRPGYNFARQCRDIGIRQAEYDLTLLRAIQTLQNRLKNT